MTNSLWRHHRDIECGWQIELIDELDVMSFTLLCGIRSGLER